MSIVRLVTRNVSYNGGVERAEAANYLGVSISTLDRFASQGRLTRGRAKRKTRPVTVFSEAELTKLKGELEEARPKEAFRRPNTDKLPEGVGFRLDPYYMGQLKKRGDDHGLSVGEYARKLVVQGIENDAEERMRTELSLLRRNLSQMFYLLLVSKLGASQADAMEVVRALEEGE